MPHFLVSAISIYFVIHLPHLKGQAMKILTDVKLVNGAKEVREHLYIW